MAQLQQVGRSLIGVLILVAGLLWLGCGKSEYDRRMDTRIQQLRTVASEPEATEEEPVAAPAAPPEDEDVDEDEDEVDPNDDDPFDEAAEEDEEEEELEEE